MVCQVRVSLSRGTHSTECVIQVQNGAPVDFLLGTDVLSQLGILVLACDSGDDATDLLSNQSWSKRAVSTVSEQPITNVEPQEGMVKLVTTTRLPARHVRIVRAKVEGASGMSVALLQPAK